MVNTLEGEIQFDESGLLVSNNNNASWIAVYHLNIAVDGDDNAIITTVDQRTGSWEVYAWKIGLDGSMPWGQDGVTLTNFGVGNMSPRLTVLPDNSAVVTWTHNDNSVLFQRISPDGALLWGDGILMEYLKFNQSNDVRGLEPQKDLVQKCIAKGLSVIEGDAEKELVQFPEKSFDYVILSQTLQAFLYPEKVLDQLLRIGKQTVVTIPNFGHWKVRLHLLFKGTMPITKNLPNEWYDTPNLHMCTIQDFVNFCHKKNIKIDKSMCLTNEKISEITKKNMNYKNIFSQLGIFLIQ